MNNKNKCSTSIHGYIWNQFYSIDSDEYLTSMKLLSRSVPLVASVFVYAQSTLTYNVALI